MVEKERGDAEKGAAVNRVSKQPSTTHIQLYICYIQADFLQAVHELYIQADFLGTITYAIYKQPFTAQQVDILYTK